MNQITSKNLKMKQHSGFALPTVLISSLIMLAVLMMSVVSTSAVRSALDAQYYDQLSKNASEAGLAYAQACLSINNGRPLWTTPLKPNTNCSGSTIPGKENEDYVLFDDDMNIKVSFEVNRPSTDTEDRATNLLVESSTSLLRDSDNRPWRTYGQTSRLSHSDQTRKQIVSGENHTCTIAYDNQVYCWGANGSGQLGVGDTSPRNSPTKINNGSIPPNETITSLSVGPAITCAITSALSNNAYCWGYNNFGQLGNGGTYNQPSPVRVGGSLLNKRVIAISAGNYRACAIISTNETYCWGKNDLGQLGIGSFTSTTATPNYVSPTIIRESASVSYQFSSIVAGGWGHTCAIRMGTNTNTYCWGNNTYGQLGWGVATNMFSLSDGGTTGGTQPRQRYNPSPIVASYTVNSVTSGTITAPAFIGITSLAKTNGSVQYMCAIKDFRVYCWGHNYYGQLGYATVDADCKTTEGNYKVCNVLPKAVDVTAISNPMRGKNIILVAAGTSHACALDDTGSVYCWGKNGSKQLGNGSIDPSVTAADSIMPIKASLYGALIGKNIVDISAGSNYSCAVDIDGNIYCWGGNESGQLGNNSNTMINTPTKTWAPPSIDYKF